MLISICSNSLILLSYIISLSRETLPASEALLRYSSATSSRWCCDWRVFSDYLVFSFSRQVCNCIPRVLLVVSYSAILLRNSPIVSCCSYILRLKSLFCLDYSSSFDWYSYILRLIAWISARLLLSLNWDLVVNFFFTSSPTNNISYLGLRTFGANLTVYSFEIYPLSVSRGLKTFYYTWMVELDSLRRLLLAAPSCLYYNFGPVLLPGYRVCSLGAKLVTLWGLAAGISELGNYGELPRVTSMYYWWLLPSVTW